MRNRGREGEGGRNREREGGIEREREGWNFFAAVVLLLCLFSLYSGINNLCPSDERYAPVDTPCGFG